MDIVQRIGQYFAQHEQSASDVMKQALERSQSLVPAAPPVKPPRAVKTAFFASKPTKPSATSQALSSSYQAIDAPDSPNLVTAVPTPPPSRMKSKRKAPKKKQPTRPTASPSIDKAKPSTTTQQSIAHKLQESWRLTCERAKKIQSEQEAKLKEDEELERQEKARRDSQLQQIEAARRQAFAKPRPPSPTVPPKQLHVAEIWCEPRRAARQPRLQRPAVALKLVKPSKAPDKTNSPSSALTTPSVPTPPRVNPISNNAPAGLSVYTNLNPVTKFGPPPSSTPYLDELETRQRTMLLEQAAALSKVREQLEQQRLVAKREADQEAMCRRREANNASLAATVSQLQLEKERLEQSLRALETEETDLRSERHRLTMVRRAARRAASESSKRLDTPEAIEAWAQEERARAAKAKLARDRAKRRVQRRTEDTGGHGGPETSDEDAHDVPTQKEGWHVSPLSSPRFQKAFFTYSSSSSGSSSSDENN